GNENGAGPEPCAVVSPPRAGRTAYQRLDPQPPPVVALRGRSARRCELAASTLSRRPPNGWPSNIVTAVFASASVDISTKPKPRDWPEMRSVTTVAETTSPAAAKCVRSSSEVVA